MRGSLALHHLSRPHPRRRPERVAADAARGQGGRSARWDGFTRLACQTRVSGDVTLERLVDDEADVWCCSGRSVRSHRRKSALSRCFFCDIRDFTPFVDVHLAYDVVHILDRFFKAVGDAILVNNGIIYQYVEQTRSSGCSVSAAIDPTELSRHDPDAGLGMLAALKDLDTELSVEFGTTLGIGIGARSAR